MRIDVTDIQTGRTLRDVVSDVLTVELPTVSDQKITEFTTDLADVWVNFFMTDEDEVDWSYIEQQSDECWGWVTNELVTRSISESEDAAEACAEVLIDNAVEFCGGARSATMKQIVGV